MCVCVCVGGGGGGGYGKNGMTLCLPAPPFKFGQCKKFTRHARVP